MLALKAVLLWSDHPGQTHIHKDSKTHTSSCLYLKRSHMWEWGLLALIIHLVGGVRWQTAYLLSDKNYTSVVCMCVFACAHLYACVRLGLRVREREMEEERARRMVQAGRWCISVSNSTNAGVEFRAEERQTVAKRSHKSNTELVGDASFSIIRY